MPSMLSPGAIVSPGAMSAMLWLVGALEPASEAGDPDPHAASPITAATVTGTSTVRDQLIMKFLLCRPTRDRRPTDAGSRERTGSPEVHSLGSHQLQRAPIRCRFPTSPAIRATHCR